MPPADAAAPSFGAFLCRQRSGPPFVDTDRRSLPDVNQDACRRALVALRRAGRPVGPDPVAAFDAAPGLARLAYHLGRGRDRDRRRARGRRRLSRDHGLTELADPRQQEALDRVVAEVAAVARLILLWHEGGLGLAPATLRRVRRLLRQAQRLKEEGTTVVPAHLRQQLRRRRRATGLARSTRPR